MAHKFYDVNGNIFENKNVEDKIAWCRKGEKMEVGFIREYGQQIGYAMNPAKELNAFVPDLISTETQILADLKTQHSPFFQAPARYGIDARFAVVFNVKDRRRYEAKYPDIDIIYYVDWIPVRAEIYANRYEIEPLFGIYKTSFRQLLALLDRSKVHTYGKRIGDKVNANDSYIFDIRNEIFQKLLPND